jgi:hypothetical protein
MLDSWYALIHGMLDSWYALIHGVILFSSAEMLNNAMSAGLGLNYTSKIHKFGAEARLKVSMKFKGR